MKKLPSNFVKKLPSEFEKKVLAFCRDIQIGISGHPRIAGKRSESRDKRVCGQHRPERIPGERQIDPETCHVAELA
jgi:hypothetical protein